MTYPIYQYKIGDRFYISGRNSKWHYDLLTSKKHPNDAVWMAFIANGKRMSCQQIGEAASVEDFQEACDALFLLGRAIGYVYLNTAEEGNTDELSASHEFAATHAEVRGKSTMANGNDRSRDVIVREPNGVRSVFPSAKAAAKVLPVGEARIRELADNGTKVRSGKLKGWTLTWR